MVKKCSVPGCTSNYNSTRKFNKHYISVFSFPRNTDLKRSWLEAISRADYVPSLHSVVCELHFDEDDILKHEKFLQTDGTIQSILLKRPRLKENAVPKYFSRRKDTEEVDNACHVKEEVCDPAYDFFQTDDGETFKYEEVEFIYADLNENFIKEEIIDESDELVVEIGNDEICYLSEGIDKMEHSSTYEIEEVYTHEIGHTCNICGESFTEALDLRAHVEVHVRGFDFRCMICGEDFIDEQACGKHVQEQHSDENITVCSENPETPSWTTKSKSHVSTCNETERHSRKKRKRKCRHRKSSQLYPCRICGKTFNTKNSQQIHIRKHTGERPFACRFCEKSFTDSGSLRKHERIHTGEKPYACVVCSKAFNQRIVLRNHITSYHSSPNPKNKFSKTPYSCSVCTDMFSKSQELIEHLINHCDINTVQKISSECGKNKYKTVVGLKPKRTAELDR